MPCWLSLCCVCRYSMYRGAQFLFKGCLHIQLSNVGSWLSEMRKCTEVGYLLIWVTVINEKKKKKHNVQRGSFQHMFQVYSSKKFSWVCSGIWLFSLHEWLFCQTLLISIMRTMHFWPECTKKSLYMIDVLSLALWHDYFKNGSWWWSVWAAECEWPDQRDNTFLSLVPWHG